MIRKVLASLVILAGLFSLVGFSSPAFAAYINCDQKPTATGCPCAKYWNGSGWAEDTPATCKDLSQDPEDADNTIQNFISILLWGIGILSVVMIIASGIVFVTSQGAPDKAKKARYMLTYSVIGLAVALLALAIVNFVFSNL